MPDNMIKKDMTFEELLKKFPMAGPILSGYGLHCIGCRISAFETIEQGAKAHGFGNEKIDEIMEDLNTNAV